MREFQKETPQILFRMCVFIGRRLAQATFFVGVPKKVAAYIVSRVCLYRQAAY